MTKIPLFFFTFGGILFFFFPPLTFDNSIVILGSINNTYDYTFTTFDGSLIFFLTFNSHLMVENWRTQHKNLSIAKAKSNQNWNTLFLLLWVLLRVLFSSHGFGREEAYREKKRRDQRDRSVESPRLIRRDYLFFYNELKGQMIPNMFHHSISKKKKCP